MSVSIHAPVKGATARKNDNLDIINVSIHAPVKGATAVSEHLCLFRQRFDPRPREGSDAIPARR